MAVDGAEGGRDAGALAGVLADPQADVLLAHVATFVSERAAAAEAAGDGVFAGAREALAMSLGADTATTVSAIGVRGRSVADGLRRLIEEHPTDLIVVGSHHRLRSGGHWPANRTRAILRGASCPVAIAPHGFAAGRRAPAGVLGVAYDDSSEAREALLFARALASETGARIEVVWFVERSNWTGPDSRVGWKAVEANRRLADLHGVTAVAVEGDPHETRGALMILAQNVDLLILGSHHHRVLRRVALGDTVEGLSLRAPCPLLVTPLARHSPRRSTPAAP